MDFIKLIGVNHHNLKNIDIEIPHNKFTVITGVSGSGKSTLAENVIYKDAERRYLETYSVYARQFLNKLNRPDVEHISGLRPAIRLEQKNYTSSIRSTVGTISELNSLIRLLFARLGKSDNKELKINRSLFSFNKPEGQCQKCKGIGIVEQIDSKSLIKDENKTLREGALVITTPSGYTIYSQVTIDVMNEVCNSEGFSVDIPWKDLTDYQKNIVLFGSDKIKILYGKHALESRMKWKGITAKPREEGYYKGIIPVMEEILKRDRNKNILRFVKTNKCDKCSGSRFNLDALSVKFKNKNIAEILSFSIEELIGFFRNLKFESENQELAKKITGEIIKKSEILSDLGLSYLSLNRNAESLSGSEASRLKLASQISNSMRGVLYIFDEPAAGLHAYDLEKLLAKIFELRDNGNTVVAVDHNKQIINSADYVIELGPDAGINGGNLIYQAWKPDWNKFYNNFPESKTARYLSDKEHFRFKNKKNANKFLSIKGANSRNLKNVNIDIPLNQLVVVTGVSGAGKSSLIKYTLANYLNHKLNKKDIDFGKFNQISGIENIDKIIEADQSPIGKTPRSNPATYTKLFDEIRDLYSNLEESKKNKLTKSHFSFNVKAGRCETCLGAGYIQTGMHFLSNVEYLCPDCNGKRFLDNVLDIKYNDKNIFDVLELSVNQAIEFFKGEKNIIDILNVLSDLGLGYIKLGQRSNSLSGGESQRIKLAAELAKQSKGKTLFVLDEPTRGLHFHDIDVLLKALNKLINTGNSIIVIEHNLYFIQSADYVIDIGPQRAKNGGNIVFEGTPQDLINCKKSLTAKALNNYYNKTEIKIQKTLDITKSIDFKGVTTNNLKNIDICLPLNKLIVVCGLSGSGKSSLIFDTIYSESQRLFNENFFTYFRTKLPNNKKAGFESANGLSPAIALQQRKLNANEYSTIATITEIYDYYRLLFSRFAQMQFPEKANKFTAGHFSFNQAHACCNKCQGLGFNYFPDEEKIISNPEKSIFDGAMNATKTGKFYSDINGQYIAILQAVAISKNIDFSIPWEKLAQKYKEIAFLGCKDEMFDVVWNFKRGNNSGNHNFKSKWIGFSAYILEEFNRKQADNKAEQILPLMKKVICNSCKGQRLNNLSLSVKILNKNISDLTKLSVNQTIIFFNQTDKYFNVNEKVIFKKISIEVLKRLNIISNLGLDYLKLNRLTNSLSGGESQRIRLAGMIGTELTGITYILDEPTTGLHTTDNEKLIIKLKELRDLGNTVIVAEHDEEIIRNADYIIDMGVGAGEYGGNIVFEGNFDNLLKSKNSLTASYLKNNNSNIYRNYNKIYNKIISVENANANNLKSISFDIYDSCINVITGVSGSGKSSLLIDVIKKSLQNKKAINCQNFVIHNNFDKIIIVDKNLPKKSILSTPVSYSGVLDLIRELFAKQAQNLNLKINKSHFSLNT
ncbi:MAG: excinuclease ABC subunit UvrA, partial [Bacteroidales bacterium]|nr:excinuclease ABC subunit UvrA [Bacteroidales bacterium]